MFIPTQTLKSIVPHYRSFCQPGQGTYALILEFFKVGGQSTVVLGGVTSNTPSQLSPLATILPPATCWSKYLENSPCFPHSKPSGPSMRYRQHSCPCPSLQTI